MKAPEDIKFIGELSEGAKWALWRGKIIVVDLNKPPLIYEQDQDGKWIWREMYV
jgi:hypothetical protein